MAKTIKIGYLDNEFRKTKMGRTTSTQKKYTEYQKRLAERLAIPCLLYTSPSPRDLSTSRMPSSA